MSTPRADLMILVGPADGEPAADVRVAARFSRDGNTMTALVGPGGWFRPDQVLARRVGGEWYSAGDLPGDPELAVIAERSQGLRGDRWRPVNNGRISAAPRNDSRRGGQRAQRGAW